jgi:hypothetical protein
MEFFSKPVQRGYAEINIKKNNVDQPSKESSPASHIFSRSKSKYISKLKQELRSDRYLVTRLQERCLQHLRDKLSKIPLEYESATTFKTYCRFDLSLHYTHNEKVVAPKTLKRMVRESKENVIKILTTNGYRVYINDNECNSISVHFGDGLRFRGIVKAFIILNRYLKDIIHEKFKPGGVGYIAAKNEFEEVSNK